MSDLFREGYLQKRAGTSRLRWNIRYFELSKGHLKWWRPQFNEMLRMPRFPKVALKDPRPRPIRSLDMTKLKSVTRTRVRFPYSTRILLCFHEDYTKYQLELRAERENIILDWFRVCARFAMESSEVEVERGEEEIEDSTATPGSHDDEAEEGFEDVAPDEADVRARPTGGAPSSSSGYPTSAPAPFTEM